MHATRSLIRPPALRVGDTIAFVAPASGLAAIVPHRLERAREELESHGFRVKIYPSVTRTAQENFEIEQRGASSDGNTSSAAVAIDVYSSASPETRARELMDAFRDPEVKAIVCTIGGFTSHELLEHLDFDAIRADPTIFVGFSDITTLHCALFTQAQLCTFYGPSAVCQFGEFPRPLAYTLEAFFKTLCEPEPIGPIAPSLEWTDDKTANWITQADMTYVDKMTPNAGYVWLRGGSASGVILGGCLPVLLNVRGTQFMPDLQDAILLLETPEGHAFDKGMALSEVNAVLGCLRADGTFKKIRGLVVGRAFAYSAAEVVELQRLLLHHTRGCVFPILYGVDVGHTNPIATIPLGCIVALDSSSSAPFAVLESGVA